MVATPKTIFQDGPAVMPVHSPLYALGVSRRLFLASTALAGVIIPINAASLLSTFTLENPAASTVNLELHRLRLGIAGNATGVIGEVALAYQNPLTALTTTTLGTITSSIIGSGVSSQATFYTKGAFTGTPTVLDHTGISFGGTTIQAGPMKIESDLSGLILPPGGAVTVVGNVAQTQAMALSLLFSENPIP